MQTQWRTSFGGPVGLDYVAVDSVLRRLNLDDEAAVFEGLQVMEFAALRAMKD